MLNSRTESIARSSVGVAGACEFEQEFSDWQLGVSVPEADKAGHQCHKEDFEQRMLLDDGYATEGSGPDSGCFDEQRTEDASDCTSEYEGNKLEKLPVEVVANFE
jgi:hypothetical protein